MKMILVDSNFGLHIWLLLNNKDILSKDVDISIDSTLYVNLIFFNEMIILKQIVLIRICIYFSKRLASIVIL